MAPKYNLHEKDEYVEFTMSSNLYSEADAHGKTKLIKKNILTRISVYIDDIQAHEHVFDSKGKVLTSYCRIYHINIGPLVLKHSYKYISDIKKKQHTDDPTAVVGFTKPTSNYGKSK